VIEIKTDTKRSVRVLIDEILFLTSEWKICKYVCNNDLFIAYFKGEEKQNP
jgi:hypothetical protein